MQRIILGSILILYFLYLIISDPHSVTDPSVIILIPGLGLLFWGTHALRLAKKQKETKEKYRSMSSKELFTTIKKEIDSNLFSFDYYNNILSLAGPIFEERSETAKLAQLKTLIQEKNPLNVSSSFDSISFHSSTYTTKKITVTKNGISFDNSNYSFSQIISYRYIPKIDNPPSSLMDWMAGISRTTNDRDFIELFVNQGNDKPLTAFQFYFDSCRILDSKYRNITPQDIFPLLFEYIFREWIKAGNQLACLPKFTINLVADRIHFDGSDITVDRRQSTGLLKSEFSTKVIRFPLTSILNTYVFEKVAGASTLEHLTYLYLDKAYPTRIKGLTVDNRPDVLCFNTNYSDGRFAFKNLYNCALSLRFMRETIFKTSGSRKSKK